MTETATSIRGDIRELYDAASDVTLITCILNTRCPPAFATSTFDTSGIDCLTTVVRLVYTRTMLGQLNSLYFWASIQEERRNPILGYAWQLFDCDHPAQYKMDTKNKIIKAITELNDQSIGGFTFRDLCLSTTMTETLWGAESSGLRLYRPRLFQSKEKSAIVKWTCREIGDQSLLVLDWAEHPGQTIEGLLNDLTRSVEVPEGQEHYFLDRPCVIRVLVKPSARDRRKPTFASVRSFALPIGEFKHTDTITYNPQSRRERYGLIAVVRMRSESKQPDYVRTYHTNGLNIVPETNHEKYMGGAKNWSFDDDTEHEYMLFYAWCDGTELRDEFAEVQPRPVDDDTAWIQEIEDTLALYPRRDVSGTSSK